jgi:hypothetical protein
VKLACGRRPARVAAQRQCLRFRRLERWALGTGSQSQAVLELHSRQIEFEFGLVHLNPLEREQVPRKYRPTVRLGDALWEELEGGAVAFEGEPVKSIKTELWRACDRADSRAARPTPSGTAGRRMRRSGAPPWEVAAQPGHSVGKGYAITERYAFYSPLTFPGLVGR